MVQFSASRQPAEETRPDDGVSGSVPADHEIIEVTGTAPRLAPPRPRPRSVIDERPAISYQLTATDLRTLPGTANDALRALQILPGSARLPFSFGGVVLRGTSPRDNAIYLDGIEVPLALHFGGVTSFYPSHMLDGLTVTNTGISAAYGRAQGGLISLTTREPRGDRWRTGGSVDEVIDEAHLGPGHILEGIERFAKDRDLRIRRMRDAVAAAEGGR